MIVYIDNDYKCHPSNDGNMVAVEVDFFNGKCDAFIEGYRFIPSGESWTREDGMIFNGELLSPWKDYDELDDIQFTHECNLASKYSSVLSEIEAAISAPLVSGTMFNIVEVRKRNILSRINEIKETFVSSSTA